MPVPDPLVTVRHVPAFAERSPALLGWQRCAVCHVLLDMNRFKYAPCPGEPK